MKRIMIYSSAAIMGIVILFSAGMEAHAFCVEGGDKSTLYVCEAAIDALSVLTLCEQKGKQDWQSMSVQTLGGVYAASKDGTFTAPAALEQYLKTHPQTKKIIVGTDNDGIGRETAKAIETLYGPKYDVKIALPPREGLDYNQYLIQSSSRKMSLAR